jgi:hypothetical protein
MRAEKREGVIVCADDGLKMDAEEDGRMCNTCGISGNLDMARLKATR